MVLTKAVYLNPYLYNFANLLINTRSRKSGCNYANDCYAKLSQCFTLHLSKLLSNGYTFFCRFIDKIYVIAINLYYPIILFTHLHKSIQLNKRQKEGVLRERPIAPFSSKISSRIDLSITQFIIYNKLRRYQTLFKFLQFLSNSHICHLLCPPFNQSTDFAMAIGIQRVKWRNILSFPHYFFFLISWLGLMLGKRYFWRNGFVGLKKQIITLKVFKEDVGNFHYLL